MSHQLPDPEREDPGWPRLQVENRAYQTYAFRKLHLEVATRQDGLQVLHCVMYPRPNFDLPILSLDLVAMEGRVTLAIIDPCPVTQDLSLPAYYTSTAAGFQERYGVATNRSIPEWVTAIFSQLCVLMRPQTPEEVGAFLKYAIALCAFHAQMGRLAAPVRATRSVSDAQAMRQRAEIQAAHERYCAKQLENDKTRRVLEGAFGSGPAEEYMRVVMFDAAEAAAKEAAAAAAPGNGAAGTNGSVPKTAPSP